MKQVDSGILLTPVNMILVCGLTNRGGSGSGGEVTAKIINSTGDCRPFCLGQNLGRTYSISRVLGYKGPSRKTIIFLL